LIKIWGTSLVAMNKEKREIVAGVAEIEREGNG
jgi:hypothetical protein